MYVSEFLIVLMIILVSSSFSRRSTAILSTKGTSLGRNFFALKQSFNFPGIKALGLLFAQPNLLIPDIELRGIQYLDANLLLQKGIRCVVFDKDNTLSYCYSEELHPNAIGVIDECKKTFNNNIAILSNSAGSSDDVDQAMAVKTEKALGIPVIRHKVKKPGCLEEVLAHFQSKALSSSSTTPLPLLPSHIAVVGDRLLTDIAFARQHHMLAVLVPPLSRTRDLPIAIVLRELETRILLPLAKLFARLFRF